MPEIEPETSETLHDIKYTPKHQEHVHSLHNSENTLCSLLMRVICLQMQTMIRIMMKMYAVINIADDMSLARKKLYFRFYS